MLATLKDVTCWMLNWGGTRTTSQRQAPTRLDRWIWIVWTDRRSVFSYFQPHIQTQQTHKKKQAAFNLEKIYKAKINSQAFPIRSDESSEFLFRSFTPFFFFFYLFRTSKVNIFLFFFNAFMDRIYYKGRFSHFFGGGFPFLLCIFIFFFFLIKSQLSYSSVQVGQ